MELVVMKDGRSTVMTREELMDELTYANYRYNRQLNPEITPAQWRKVIPQFTEAMERRYQNGT